jgi:Protein of unknown function (DUF1016).
MATDNTSTLKTKNDGSYSIWLKELKQRYLSQRLKASISVNTALLEFYWSLGGDIEAKQYANTYGSGFYKNLSKDLQHELPNVKGLSPINIRYMTAFYKLYSPVLEIVPQAAEDFNKSMLFSIPWDHHRRIIDRCKDKDNVVAKYALDAYNQPLGISEYQLSKLIPDDFKSTLQTIEEIEKELNNSNDK